MAGGRWYRVDELAGKVASESEAGTRRAHAQAMMLLERYGVICRETALAEEIPGGFAFLYPVLREMEEAGRVRRGYFIDGLAGRQFALAGAVDRLRAEREIEVGEGEVISLAAVDPANPWGSLLPWPELAAADGPKPRRTAGATVVLLRGEPMLYIDSGGRRLLTFASFEREPGRAVRAVEELVQIARRQRKRSMLIEKVNGEPAGDFAFVAPFDQAGFVREYRGLLWSLSSRPRQTAG
jgi:ATP-dependent Lhr-like helicase